MLFDLFFIHKGDILFSNSPSLFIDIILNLFFFMCFSRCHQWVLYCQRLNVYPGKKRLNLTSDSMICSDHFIPEHFVKNTNTLLKRTAVPCVAVENLSCYSTLASAIKPSNEPIVVNEPHPPPGSNFSIKEEKKPDINTDLSMDITEECKPDITTDFSVDSPEESKPDING